MTTDEFCQMSLSLPEAEERETWGEVTFRVRGNIFAILSPSQQSATIKATLPEQDGLVNDYPETFAIGPYTGRFGWIAVKLTTVDSQLLRDRLIQAWRRTTPKRAAAAYDAIR